ncbi:50S ribosomal protein L25/general stress protein Ctc [Luteithermobacter gelatinilyticus]|uniref:50S ribosomal protein L25/general stress protein Ctc n=1 Tax=Luteithermobacter gelatinilyticus TaxID=2582913 RepID=UPI0011067ADF|nr:50S ribosomal protein L25/general stress protein Ctc [Luteithermobacter gelatinilyticus]
MANPVIKAELREKAGKGSSRALRRAGRIPAVIYGNKKEPVTISLDRIALVKELNTGGFLNTTYDIEVGGKKEMVLPRDVQFHPVTDWPLHVDFLRLAEDATIEVMIPVHFLNEEDCPGLRAGGVLNVVRHEVELSCPANAIPESIEIDIAKLELGESVHISHVKLPEGVTPVITDRDFTIATIAAPSGLKSAEAEAEKAEVEEEGETEENNE